MEAGRGDGQPLLLLHGYSDSWFSFSRILELLPANLRLIIPDQRGHGESERPENGYELDDFAADAIALLDHFGIASANVVGHSMGSFIGQRMAALAPTRIAKLVLVGSAASPRNENVMSLAEAVQALKDPVDIDFVRQFQMSTIHRPVPAAFLEGVIRESLKLPARVWQAVLSGLIDTPFPSSAVASSPVSIFWGDKDAIFGATEQNELLRRLPNARLHVFTDVGHDPQWEVPEDFVRELIPVLDSPSL
jgi:pimeloyl-ACP methyl ester carboxylesterase